MPFSCFKKSVSVVEEGQGSSAEKDAENELASFFVITAIFNPASFNSRYELYHQFAQHMADTGAQLITVECIFPELGQSEFKVTSSTNQRHVQIKSKSVYWMKENLINLAVSKLPMHAKWVCWLDADIEFEDKNWVQLAIEQCQQYTVVQIFKRCKFLGPKPLEKVLREDYSFGYSVVRGKPIDQNRYDEWYPHPGYGWAMSLSTFHLMNGLPEYDILGSADLHFAFSLINKVSNAIETNLNPNFSRLILARSAETYQILSEVERPGTTANRVGFVPVTIRHHWHGSREDRQYVDRWKILIAHQFDFERDMQRTKEGLLEFLPGREALQKDILDHFRLRNEDKKEAGSRPVKVKGQAPLPPEQFRGHSPEGSRFRDDATVVLVASRTFGSLDHPSIEEHCPSSCPPKYDELCHIGGAGGDWEATGQVVSQSEVAVCGVYADNYGDSITTTSLY